MKTITDLLQDSIVNFPNNTYLWQKNDDTYQSMSYYQVLLEVHKFAAGLMKLGINKGDRMALISESRNEWVIGELGILYAGAINVPMSVKLNEPAELIYRLNHSGARMIVASQNQAKKIRPILQQLPALEKIIIIDELDSYNDNEICFKNIIQLGKEFLETNLKEFTERWKSIKPSDYATICYTSGTTADPKGIILTHNNYTANVDQSLSLHDVPGHFVTLLILPWDHAFAHTCGIYTVMKNGASIASVQTGKTPIETLKNIGLNIRETKPHFLMSVPALAKNFKKNIESGITSKGKVVEVLFKFGLKVAYTYNGIGWDKGKGWRILLKPVYALIDKIIFSKVRENFGGRIKFFVGGGALLDIELQRFFYAIGIPMLQGYGLTEASPVISSNSLKEHKLGSSGKLVSNLELRICDDKANELPIGEKGEIVVRGENVMAGYWQNPEATEQTLVNGWLHTGDMGYMDKDGFLYVLGRFKSLLIADDGEKYSPESIEEAFVAQSPYIEQCMLYNNQNPYTVAIIVPNKEAIKRWLNDKNHHHGIEGADDSCKALKLIEREISEYRTGKKHGTMFPQRWLPAAIAIIDEPFTEDNNMINSTLKLVRGKVIEHYKTRIEYLFTPEAKDICNAQNKASIGKLLKPI